MKAEGSSERFCSVASVVFDFDGSDEMFQSIYDSLCSIDLDTAAYWRGKQGVIEFLISDFESFEKNVADKSAELGIALAVLNYSKSDKED